MRVPLGIAFAAASLLACVVHASASWPDDSRPVAASKRDAGVTADDEAAPISTAGIDALLAQNHVPLPPTRAERAAQQKADELDVLCYKTRDARFDYLRAQAARVRASTVDAGSNEDRATLAAYIKDHCKTSTEAVFAPAVCVNDEGYAVDCNKIVAWKATTSCPPDAPADLRGTHESFFGGANEDSRRRATRLIPYAASLAARCEKLDRASVDAGAYPGDP